MTASTCNWSEPTVTLQLTREQVEDILNDLSLGGFATTFSAVFAALPKELQADLLRQWEEDDDDEPDLDWPGD